MEPGLVNKLYRRDLFRGLETWMDASIRINEDLLMNFYLFRQAEKAVFEDVCPYHYILRRGSAATSKLNAHKLRDPERVLRILLEETAAEPEWNRIVKRRLVYLLVNAATMSLGGQKELVKPHRQRARLELRRMLWGVLMDRGYDIRLKCMALWAAVWPAGYELVHRAYAKARGTDKKFALE